MPMATPTCRPTWTADAGARVLEQPDRDRVTVGLAVIGLERGDQGAHDPHQRQHDPQRDREDQADAQGEHHQHHRQRGIDEHAEVEVDRLLRVFGGERGLVADQHPHRQRGNRASHARHPTGQQRGKQCRGMRGGRPLAVAQARGQGLHVDRFHRGLPPEPDRLDRMMGIAAGDASQPATGDRHDAMKPASGRRGARQRRRTPT